MNDRELLERAAKAAWMPAFWDELSNAMRVVEDGGQWYLWRPLVDDGDAFRLAVALRLEVDIHHTGIAVRTAHGIKILIDADEQPDPYAATRRAIVRAAASLVSS